jgi:hypothetical protein
VENLQDTKNWIDERLLYIAQNCNLQDADNKRAVESLKTALKCVEKVENELDAKSNNGLEIPDFSDDKIMNIRAHPGTKVKVTEQTAKNGYPGDQEAVKKWLEIGKVYTVAYTVVGQSHTSVVLQELPKRSFNSVNFVEIGKE